MYGSNDYGSAYYGQGPAEGTTFTLHAVSATVTALASISSILLINQTLNAVVTASASISRMLGRSLSTSVSVLGVVTTQIVLGLNIRNAKTKFLTLFNSTRSLEGFSNTTKELNLTKKTKRITES